MQPDKTMSPQEVVAHMGVRGMKWGVRKSKSTTGVSRLRAGASQSLRDANFRKQRRRSELLGHVPGHNAVSKHNEKKLAESKARIDAGKTKARDILRVSRHMTYGDLIFTTTPTKTFNK